MRTIDVFFEVPDSFAALRSRVSSMLRVVLIHTMMLFFDISVKLSHGYPKEDIWNCTEEGIAPSNFDAESNELRRPSSEGTVEKKRGSYRPCFCPQRSRARSRVPRKLCLSLPGTSERLSHGAPTFFIRDKRAFVTFMDNHHGDGRLAIWWAAPAGVQCMLVAAAPQHYFVPPYVRYR